MSECQNSGDNVERADVQLSLGQMEIIAIANQKGGTAKTTTAAALGLLLSRAGRRVHLIDMDPQGSLTHAFGQAAADGELFQALALGKALPNCSLDAGLSLTPSHITLSRGETEFIAKPGREHCLARSLAAMQFLDDTIVLVDCPPSLGVLAVNCLTAASRILIVVQPGGFELRALVHFEETVKLLREWVNPQLQIVGTVLTNCHARRKITGQVADEVARAYPLLGRVRADAQLLYGTTAGTVLNLRQSKALADYESVRINLEDRLTWPRTPSLESPAYSAD
jgi:chromosome partitioning protein